MLKLKTAGFPGALTLAMASSMVASPAHADIRSGRQSASATSAVTLGFPSVHGVNVPAAPSRPASSGFVFASRVTRKPADALPLQVFGNSADGTIQMVRTLPNSAASSFVLASSRQKAPESLEVRTSSREGALGWTLVRDRIESSATRSVTSGQAQKTTVVYEVWDF